MQPDVAAVIELQQADSRLADLTLRRDTVPSEIRAVQSQLKDFLQAYEQHQQQLTTNQKERRELEGEIQAIRDKIGRHKDQLYQVKKNEQYKAMLHEIAGEEQNIRQIEDRILEKMVEAEQLDKYVKDAAARLEGEKARVAGEVKRLESEKQAAEEERSQLEEKRRTLAASLAEAVLALYERARKARGFAVAEVRDGSCSGCHVLLRPQAYNQVRQDNSLQTCETCGRILYYVESPVDRAAEGTRVALS